VTFAHWGMLLKSLGRYFRRQPGEFFLPPKMDIPESGKASEASPH
jgi:hypothetical protein